MSSARPRRTAAAFVAVWVLGLIVVLALWQRVDAACHTDGVDRAEALATCDPVGSSETVPGTGGAPVVTVSRTRG